MIKEIPIEVSARHIHLAQKDLDVLFGKGYELKKVKNLSQFPNFLTKEKLNIEANLKTIFNVAIIGPSRKETQVELSHTDIIYLRLKPVVRDSGDVKGTPGITLVAPNGKIKIKQGVINSWRHIHCNLKEAKKLGLKNGELVSVKTKGDCSLSFHNVMVRVAKKYKFSMHLDTDEGNAAGITKKGVGYLINT